MFGDMNGPVLIFCLLSIISVVSYYFYTRFIYIEKKVSFIQNVIMEIKMAEKMASMANEDLQNPMQGAVFQQPEVIRAAEVEVLPDDKYYENVIAENVEKANEETPSTLEEVVQPVLPNYEAMSKNELQNLVKQRSLKVSKNAKIPEILSILRKDDEMKRQTEEPAPAPASSDSMLELSETLETLPS